MTSSSLVYAFDELVRSTSVLTAGIEPEFQGFVQHQEECRKKWLQTEYDNIRLREELAKLQAEKDALGVKLKHARNQVDVEMKRRMKAEASEEDKERQITLIRELLTDSNKISMLNDREKESLAFLNSTCNTNSRDTPVRRLSAIDESNGSILSDISFDRTNEDLDVSLLRSGSPWARTAPAPPAKKKRPSAPPMEDNQTPPKKTRSDTSLVTQTTVTVVPTNGRPITTTTHVQAIPQHHGADSDSDYGHLQQQAQQALKSCLRNVTNSPSRGPAPRVHSFCSKTVMKPETCQCCNKRIKFGKLALKCKDCRAVCHPDCKDQAPPCQPTASPGGQTTPGKAGGTHPISWYAPQTSPMVPQIVVHCINEVETRGMTEAGIYRVPGSDRAVKELTEKMLKAKGPPNLKAVADIHEVCGALKYFLRERLSEPLVTQRLHPNFMAAAWASDELDGQTACYQAVSQLPPANRHTMAFVALHLQRVAESKDCMMNAGNLARVFGPTLVGYSADNIDPMLMMEETKQQQKVVERLLSLPSDFWAAFITVDPHDAENAPVANSQTPVKSSLLGPISTPKRTESTSSISSIGSLSKKKNFFSRTPKFGGHPAKKSSSSSSSYFFSSPTLK